MAESGKSTPWTAAIPVVVLAVVLGGPALVPFKALLPHLPELISQRLPILDEWAGSPLAKRNIPWGFNPSPSISEDAEHLPSKVCSVPPSSLAVLSKDGPFRRERLEPLQSTRLAPDATELPNSNIGASLRDCKFVAFDDKFQALTGSDPTLRRLAHKDYEFAHEVS
jgi:hypothetical protein